MPGKNEDCPQFKVTNYLHKKKVCPQFTQGLVPGENEDCPQFRVTNYLHKNRSVPN